MSYIGIHRCSGNNSITVKIHGPVEAFNITPINPKELAAVIDRVILKNMDKPTSALPLAIAEDLCDIYVDGKHLLWVEVNMKTSTGILYGAAAENVMIPA